MAVLDNPRHELFAQELAKGKSASEALTAIGSPTGRPQGFYVYVLIDPRDSTVFYVGKGKGNRLNAHYRFWRAGREKNAAKSLRMSEIVAAGFRPEAAWISDGMTEASAYKAERHVMFSIGLENLTNSIGAPMPELERARLMARESLAMVRPYCRMLNLSPPASDGWEHMYWGVIASLYEIANDHQCKIPPFAYYAV